MPERFGSVLAPSGAAAVPVTPGAGSSGFSSRSLVFGDSVGALTNNSSGPSWDTTAGRLAVGTTETTALVGNVSRGVINAYTTAANQPGVMFTADSPGDAALSLYTAGVTGTPVVLGGKARGLISTLADVTVGDVALLVLGQGYAGGAWRAVYDQRFIVTAVSGTTVRGDIAWFRSSAGGGAATETMRLNSSGHLGIGTTAPTDQIHVLGGLTVEGSGAAGGFNFRRGAVSSGIAGTLQFQGQDISATTDGMTYASVQGFITVASTSVPQSELRFRVSNASSNLTQAMTLNSSGDLGVGTSAPASRVHVLTSVNGNAFRVDATTGSTSGLSTAQPAFNVQSTGSTSKVGFWTTVGSTRGAAYTTSGSTVTRTVPTTVTTGTQTTVQVKEVQNAVNGLIAVVNNLVADFQGFGLVG